MFELRVLGGLRLGASDRREVESLTRQTKRAALLAYLAAATPRGTHRRDKLLTLFWPELDEPRARAALSQAVYVLRATLGEDTVVSSGDDALALADIVWCDAAAFETALDAGSAAEALSLYRGDLLDGFLVSDAPGFERWLDGERARLRQRAFEGAWALADAKAAEGDAAEAGRWARWGADQLPTDETVIRRLMTFLRGLGDRAAAIHAYESFISRLRREYELEPSAETQALAATIRQEQAPMSPLQADVRTAPAAGIRPVRRHHWVRDGLAVAGAIIIVLGMVIWVRLYGTAPGAQPAARFTLEFPTGREMAAGVAGSTIALSPDGSHLVYVVKGPPGTELFLRPLNRVEAVPISETRGARLPFFSPDGEWLGFVSGDVLRKVRLAGGPAITVCRVGANVMGASWGANVIVFATSTGLWQVPASGGDARLFAVPDTARGQEYRWPEVLPNGRAAVVTTVDRSGFRLVAVSLETGEVHPLGLEGASPHFTPGYVLVGRTGGALLAAPFDANRLRITGPALPVTGDAQVGIGGAAKVGLSHTGALAYVPAPSGNRTLMMVDRHGQADTVPVPPRGFTHARISPDGRRIAAAVLPAGGGQQPDVWMLEIDSRTSRRVTNDRRSQGPIWSADGRRIVFGTMAEGPNFGWTIRWIASDGASQAETLTPARMGQFPQAFTPDGSSILLAIRDAPSGWDLWILPLNGSGPHPYLRSRSDEHSPDLSPDGRWLAYVSNETGQEEVLVRPFPGAGNPVQVSAGGGRQPQWAPSGEELFYRSGKGMVAVSVSETWSSFRVGRRTVLFDDTPYLSLPYGVTYDVHPDGRFLMIREGVERPRVEILLNWGDQLRAVAPAPPSMPPS